MSQKLQVLPPIWRSRFYWVLHPDISTCRTLLYTAEMSNPARTIEQRISQIEPSQ